MSATMNDAPARWRDLFQPQSLGRVLAMSGGVALHAINLYVTATVLPNVVSEIGGLPYYAWATTLFVIASIISAALGAQAVRRHGPRRAYASATVAFALGSAVCGLAPSMPVLLVGRLLQGIGGGLLVSMPYVLMRDLLPQRLWTRALALLSGMWGVATLLGPAVGGLFTEYASWRLAFFASVPAVLGVAIAAMVSFRAAAPARAAPAVPVAQLSILAAAVLAASWGSSADQLWHGVGAMVVAASLLCWLARKDARATARLLPAATYASGSVLAALYGLSALLAVTVTCTEVFVPLFLQKIQQHGPLAAGYIAASASAGWTLASVWSSTQRGELADRCIRLAPTLCCISMLSLAYLLPRPALGDPLNLGATLVALVLGGAGVGIAWPHLASAILGAAVGDDEDLAAGSIMTVQLVATTFGAALGGFVLNAALRWNGEPDMRRAAVALLLFLAALPACAILLANRGRFRTAVATRQ